MNTTHAIRRQAALAICVAFAIVAGLWVATRTHATDHIGSLNALARLQQANSAIQHDALTVRFGMLQTYDPLLASIEDSAQAQRALREHSRAVVGEPAPLQHALQRLDEQSLATAAVVGTFNTQVSQYRNSLTYLPTALRDWSETARTDATLDGHTEAAEELTRRALVYNAIPSHASSQRLQQALDDVQALETPTDRRAASRWRLIVRHADLVHSMGAPLHRSVDELLAPTVDEHITQVRQAYVDAYQSVMRRHSGLRLATYGLVVVGALMFIRLVRTLRDLYQTLETRIEERTAELGAAVAGSRHILDNVNDGLLSVDITGQPGTEASAALRRWLGVPDEGDAIWDWFARFNPSVGEWLRLGWEDLQAGFMPHSVILSQLPDRLTVGERSLRLQYCPILDPSGALVSVLLLLSDVTEHERLQAQRAREEETVRLFTHVVKDPVGLRQCVEQTEELLEELLNACHRPVVSRRIVHTIKGNVGMYDIQRLARACHDLETRIQDESRPIQSDDALHLRRVWDEVMVDIAPFLQAYGTIQTGDGRLAELRTLIEQRAPYDDLARLAAHWTDVPLENRLNGLARRAASIAERLERPIHVRVQANGLRLPPVALRELWAAMPHVLRNAVDHGIEDPVERAHRGKVAQGQITLITRQAGSSLVLVIQDDGGGIDWERLRQRAHAQNIPHAQTLSNEQLLFADGLSSRDEVSDLSGRGLGMAAFRQAIEQLGGSVRVLTARGQGTTFECTIPNVFESSARMAS